MLFEHCFEVSGIGTWNSHRPVTSVEATSPQTLDDMSK